MRKLTVYITVVEMRSAELTTALGLDEISSEVRGAADFWRSLGKGPLVAYQETCDSPPAEYSDQLSGYLNYGGPVIAEGLSSGSPSDVHDALDTLLTIEQSRSAIPENPAWRNLIDAPGKYVEANASDMLEKIIDSSDSLASLKALRFLCHRTIQGSISAGDALSRHVYKIISPNGGAETQRTARGLQRDLLEAMSPDDVEGLRLRDAFLRGIGYKKPRKLADAWREVGTERAARQIWWRKNLETILALEQREPGLAKAITKTFRIRNFARNTPDMLHAMYRARIDHPEQPYVEKLVARYDNNFSHSKGATDEKLFRKLQKLGIGYEIHEFGSASDLRHASAQAEIRAAQGGQITDLIVKAHGDRRGVRGSSDFIIAEENVRILQPWQSLLRQDAHVIVSACEGAQPPHDGQSIAERIQQQLERHVIGSKKIAFPYITANKNGRMDALFYASAANVKHAAPVARITAGLEIAALAVLLFLENKAIEKSVEPEWVDPVRYPAFAVAIFGTAYLYSAASKARARKTTVILPARSKQTPDEKN